MRALDVIIHFIEITPEAWQIDDYWAKHTNGMWIWIGNGFWNCHIEKPEYQELNFFERIRLYRALKKMKAEKEESLF